MKVYRGTRNLSPLKIKDYYGSNGHFGEGMYFGIGSSQPKSLSMPRENEFRVIGTFILKCPEELILIHNVNSSQIDKKPDVVVEITKYEVIIKKDEGFELDLISLAVGFDNIEMALKLQKELKAGEISNGSYSFDVEGLSPESAHAIHKFLVEEGFKVI